jgi:hypothetical protein
MFIHSILLLASVAAVGANPATAAIPAATPPKIPAPLSPVHIRDLGCVAVVAIVADEQRRGIPSAAAFPDVQMSGRTWIGIVGDRVTFESGQPKEVVAFALRQAATAEQGRLHGAPDRAAMLGTQLGQCLPLMREDLAAENVSAPLPPPLKRK